MRRVCSAALLACALSASLAAEQDAAAPDRAHPVRAQPARAHPVRARLECAPAQVEIGEPVDWILTVEHPREISVKLPEKDPVLDDTWVMLGERSVVNDVPANPAEGVRTRVTWRAMSLESGARALPGIEVQYEESGAPHTLITAPIVLDVRGELGPEEDLPRPIKGFRRPRAGADATQRWAWIAALALVACAITVWILRRSRRKPAPLPRTTPLDDLVKLEREISADPSASRAITYALSMLLRESVDAFAREYRAGLTDFDWIEHIEKDERIPLGVRAATARILRESEQVKYALHVPTRFAVEEVLRDARNALEALAATPVPERATSAPAQGSDKEAA